MQNWHAYLSFDSNNGQRDYSGVVQVGCVLVTTFLSFVLPVFVFLLELDAPCHFFRLIFPMHLQNKLKVKIITQSVRIFIGAWSIMEGCNALRTQILHSFVLLRCYWNYMGHLKKLAFLRESDVLRYRKLQVIF